MSLTTQPAAAPPAEPLSETPPIGALGLWDAVSIIVGIVVGAGIYQTAPFIFKHTDSPTTAMSLWLVAGFASYLGALCYAELATTYPRDGGDINYLGRAFGSWAGFLFGWVQLTVIMTGSIGMMAFVFANYSIRFFKEAVGLELGVYSAFGFAGGSILALTILNLIGIALGKTVQNILSVAKVLGLGLIILAGFLAPASGAWQETSLSAEELKKLTFPGFEASLGVAFVLIFYTFGGWNDAAFVAAEVREGKRNIPRALMLGLLLITALYLLVNYAYINALGFQKAQASSQIAADVLNRGFGRGGVALMCLLVMISALGAVNGLIFTGARIYSTTGQHFNLMRWMGGWSRTNGAPVSALVTQGVISLLLVFLVGTETGRQSINALLDKTATTSEVKRLKDAQGKEVIQSVGAGHVLKPMEWEDSWKASLDIGAGEKATDLAKGGFDTLLTCTAPIFWSFFLLTGVSLFVLRERDAHIERPYKVWPYPWVPLCFCAVCGYMLYASISYALLRGWSGGLMLLGVIPLVLGLPLYHLSQVMGDKESQTF
ncbi:MAG: amino acid permease [Gemmataceae bacterium]